MTTILTYNGVSISDCLTKTFKQEPVRDPSGTDIEYVKFTVRVQSLVHDVTANTDFGFQPLTGGDSIVSAEKRLRELLMQERKTFSFTVGGVSLLAAVGTGSGSTRDVNHGPKPQYLEITHITGTKAFHVEFEIEVCLVECASDTNSRGILNNRWQIEDQIDRDNRVSRTIRGRMRVKPGVDIHNLRGVVLPPLESSFYRDSISIIVDEKGLEMAYTVTDKQYDQNIPKGISHWAGTHSQSTGVDGSVTHSNYIVDVWGEPGANKQFLFGVALKIVGAAASATLPFTLGEKRILESIELIDHMEETHVTVRVSITDLSDNGFRLTSIGAPVVFDSQGAPTPLPYGARPAIANLLVAQLQNPCNNDHDFDAGTVSQLGANVGDRTGGGTSTGGTSTLSVSVGQVPPLLEPPRTSASHKQALYTHCKVEQIHHRKAVCAVMPIARTSQDSGGSTLFAGGGRGSGFVGGTARGSIGPSAFLQQQAARLSNEQQIPTTVSVVQLGQPIHYRTIKFEMERAGKPPEIPFPEDFTEAGVAYVLIDSKDQPMAPRLLPDGRTPLYGVSGERTYVANAPPPLNQGFETGSLPWDTTNTLTNRISGSNYTRGIDHT